MVNNKAKGCLIKLSIENNEMISVTKKEFFEYILAEKQLDIHPCATPDLTEWRAVDVYQIACQVIGRSYPGWRQGGLPELARPDNPNRYELSKSFMNRHAKDNFLYERCRARGED